MTAKPLCPPLFQQPIPPLSVTAINYEASLLTSKVSFLSFYSKNETSNQEKQLFVPRLIDGSANVISAKRRELKPKRYEMTQSFQHFVLDCPGCRLST